MTPLFVGVDGNFGIIFSDSRRQKTVVHLPEQVKRSQTLNDSSVLGLSAYLTCQVYSLAVRYWGS